MENGFSAVNIFLKILLKYIYIFSILLLQQIHNQSKHTFTHMVLGDVSTLTENVNCKLYKMNKKQEFCQLQSLYCVSYNM